MVLSLAFILAFIGAAVALLIGIILFSEVEGALFETFGVTQIGNGTATVEADSPLYACDSTGQGNWQIKTVNKATGVVSNNNVLSLTNGDPFAGGCGGISQDTTTGIYYIAWRDALGSSNQNLATVDPTTAIGTDLGSFNTLIMSIAFDNTGRLFAVHGAGGDTPNHLFEYDKSNPDNPETQICQFTSSHDGGMNSIAFNYDTNQMWRFMGSGVNAQMEAVDLATCADSGNTLITGFQDSFTIMSATYNTADGLFYVVLRNNTFDGSDLYTVTLGGVATLIDKDIDPDQYWWRGMVFETTEVAGAPIFAGGAPPEYIQAQNIAYTVIGIIPVALFFFLFAIFSGRAIE